MEKTQRGNAAALGHLLGIDPNGAPLMRVREVASALNQSEQFVRDLIDRGDLFALRRPGAIRSNINVTRLSLLAYLARSADGIEAREYEDATVHLFKKLPPENQRSALLRMQEVTKR